MFKCNISGFPHFKHYIILFFTLSIPICPLCLEEVWGLPFWHLCGLAWQETLVKLLQHEKIICCPQIGYESHFLRPCWPFGNKSCEPENTEGWRETLTVCVCVCVLVCMYWMCVYAACVAWVLGCRFCNTFHARCAAERRLLLICLPSTVGG